MSDKSIEELETSSQTLVQGEKGSSRKTWIRDNNMPLMLSEKLHSLIRDNRLSVPNFRNPVFTKGLTSLKLSVTVGPQWGLLSATGSQNIHAVMGDLIVSGSPVKSKDVTSLHIKANSFLRPFIVAEIFENGIKSKGNFITKTTLVNPSTKLPIDSFCYKCKNRRLYSSPLMYKRGSSIVSEIIASTTSGNQVLDVKFGCYTKKHGHEFMFKTEIVGYGVCGYSLPFRVVSTINKNSLSDESVDTVKVTIKTKTTSEPRRKRKFRYHINEDEAIKLTTQYVSELSCVSQVARSNTSDFTVIDSEKTQSDEENVRSIDVEDVTESLKLAPMLKVTANYLEENQKEYLPSLDNMFDLDNEPILKRYYEHSHVVKRQK